MTMPGLSGSSEASAGEKGEKVKPAGDSGGMMVDDNGGDSGCCGGGATDAALGVE